MPSRLRLAHRGDIARIQEIRRAVRENRLTTTRVSDTDVETALYRRGRGWVVETRAGVVAFSIAIADGHNIWALFVDPPHEGRGHGRALLASAVDWLWTRGAQQIWLTTEAGTRAEGFYRAQGWCAVGLTDEGEVRFELTRPG